MTTMRFEDLDEIYEDLARAIDRAGPRNEPLFLAKLVLALCHRLGDPAAARACIDAALEDLPAL
jgi:hypothetical protein